jgi:endonuclease YncB( thermonuclease family)
MIASLFARTVGARRLALILIVTLWTLISLHAVAAQPPSGPLPLNVEGISVDVQDGDTFVLRDEAGRPMRIRVAGIDAPEKSQPWAERSRQHLRELLRGQRVQVLPIKQDVYGRTVARVQVLQSGDTALDAAQAQLDAGLAWHFKRYKSDQTRDEFVRYAQAERQARAAGLGLWADPQPQAPWLFRAENRSGSAARSQRP